tara:strand:+ start:657 stop:878 length:222 start_codon:yes stop_codon:yes gene_type:complete
MKRNRDLNFEVNNAKQLNEMLTGVLMQVRRGELDHDTVKSITLVADKINKNNVNQLEYKKICKHNKEIEFLEE